MKFSELANRYAKALFELTAQGEKGDKVLDELRALEQIFGRDEQIREFLASPVVKVEDKLAALKAAMTGKGLSEEVESFVALLAQKNRLGIFPQIVEAMKAQSDVAHGVTRGAVRSAVVLPPNERKQIEDIVSKYTSKQVILTYKEDPSVIGGLIAEVGSYTFDDTLTSHLRRLKDEMTRRAQ